MEVEIVPFVDGNEKKAGTFPRRRNSRVTIAKKKRWEVNKKQNSQEKKKI